MKGSSPPVMFTSHLIVVPLPTNTKLLWSGIEEVLKRASHDILQYSELEVIQAIENIIHMKQFHHA
jgi:hypothetical protein